MDSFSTLWCLFGAIIIDLYAGSWFRAGRSLWHPKNILNCLVEKLAGKLDRQGRSSNTLLIRGALSLLCTLSLAALVGIVVHWSLREVPLGWVLELAILTSLVSVGRSWKAGNLLASSLELGSTEDARQKLAFFSSRDATYSDSDEITQLGIESVIANFVSDFIGPVLFYVTLGLPGCFMYFGLRLSASCRGSREYLAFSRCLIVAVDGLLSWLGSMLLLGAVLLYSETSPTGALLQGRRVIIVGGGIRYRLAKSVVAGALGITLEGPRRYLSGQVERPYLGSGPPPSPRDLVQAIKLALAAAGITAASILACAVLF